MPPLLHKLLRYRLLIGLALAVLILDQASKAWIAGRLPFNTDGPPDAIQVIPGFFNLVHVGNTGAAWSLFTGNSGLLAIFAALTLVLIYWFRHSLSLHERAIQIAFGLLCGGIAGNLIDRIHHGHVTDFLDFHIGVHHYPTFNLADSGIVTGVLLHLLFSFRQPERKG